MRRIESLAVLAVFTAGLIFASSAHAAWPTNVFAPYVELDAGDNLQITNVKSATGLQYYTLAFLNGGTPTWGGTGQKASSGYYSSQINSIRSGGGDVIFSFGGAGATDEPALTTTDEPTLQSIYQSVVTKYNATWLDFDIEGNGILTNKTANHLRNSALTALQTANPGLRISFTLPADTSGLDSNSIDLINDAKSKGLKIQDINAMTMDFGTGEIKNTTVGAVAITSAKKVHTQVSAIDSSIGIGMTLLIGQSDNVGEVFQLSDIQPVMNYADSNSYIKFLSMWSSDRDNGTSIKNTDDNTDSGIVQTKWQFTNSFMQFPEPASATLVFLGFSMLLQRSPRRRV